MLTQNNQKKILVYSFFYEMLSDNVSIADYKALIPSSNIESFFLEKADEEEDNLFLFALYLGLHLLKKDSLRNKSEKDLDSRPAVLADIYIDFLNILPFMSSLHLLFQDFCRRRPEVTKIEKLTPFKNLLEAFYELGEELSAFYSKSGDFFDEVEKSYNELIKLHTKKNIEEKIKKTFRVYCVNMQFFEKNQFELFDIVKDVNLKLFPFKYDFAPNEKKMKSIGGMFVYSNNPFIYFYMHNDNFFEQMLLYFIEKNKALESDLINELHEIHKATHAFLFSVLIEPLKFKKETLKDLSSLFFLSNEDHGEKAILDRNILNRTVYFEKIYNYKNLESESFKQDFLNELENLYDSSNGDIALTFKSLSLKMPKIAKEKKWFIGNNIDEKLKKDLSLKMFQLMLEFIKDKKLNN